jgi:hypothetical protein
MIILERKRIKTLDRDNSDSDPEVDDDYKEYVIFNLIKNCIAVIILLFF